MNIKLRKEAAETIGLKVLEKYGVNDLGWTQRDQREIDLARLSIKQVDELYKLLEQVQEMRAVKVAMHDIRIWKKSQSDPNQWARNTRQMAALLKSYLEKVPGHRVFRKDNEQWECYYVNDIIYIPKKIERWGGVTPAHVIINLYYMTMNGIERADVRAWEKECRGLTPSQLLGKVNVYPETKDLRETYLIEQAKYKEVAEKIGLQVVAWGLSEEGLVDDDDDDEKNFWWRRETVTPFLGPQDDPAKCVIDVINEKNIGKTLKESKYKVSTEFWATKSVVQVDSDEAEDEDFDIENHLSDSDGPVKTKDIEEIEVPIHPYVPLFCLTKHIRVMHHVMKLEVYKYDTTIAEKLILDDNLKALISVLIEHQGQGFQDIIGGKGSGAVVLLCGKPGTGKTLTAEVYAESEQRALYSVQCSQLGLEPDTIEETLLKCFARAKRWNAVMLLDEADVYIHKRGDSLTQNAIVGVFLRILEYQSAVMFMTTNRPDDVDDAVASRCIAKLVYKYPDESEQEKIWGVLAELSNAKITSKAIGEIVKKNPGLSGRDVKNLLKLAMLTTQGKQIMPGVIDFVKQFKPTID